MLSAKSAGPQPAKILRRAEPCARVENDLDPQRRDLHATAGDDWQGCSGRRRKTGRLLLLLLFWFQLDVGASEPCASSAPNPGEEETEKGESQSPTARGRR